MELEVANLPACVAERGAFMSAIGLTREVTHPYSKFSEQHAHFLPTPFTYEPYSAACIPFRWMLRETVEGTKEQVGLVESLELGYQHEREPELKFGTDWVQERENQLVLLDTFFGAVQRDLSLCFFYAKRTPLVEDPRRVIVGVGRILRIDEPVEYRYQKGAKGLRCVLWERNVHHSIRPDEKDGFVLPYHAIAEACRDNGALDPANFVALVPVEDTLGFSYGSEHVTHDQAIASLLACANALARTSEQIGGNYSKQLAWIDRELNGVWRMRGPYPGFGSALCALGIEHGTLVAHEIWGLMTAQGKAENADPWLVFEACLKNTSVLSASSAKRLGPMVRKLWTGLPAARCQLLKLLSRFELTTDQATRFYQETERSKAGIALTDTELLGNPFLAFECDRGRPDAIQLGTIDRGVFPDPIVREQHPLPQPSTIEEAIDPRRVRAFAVDTLELAAQRGHTLQPRDWVIQSIRERRVRPECPVSRDLFDAIEGCLAPVVHSTKTAGGERAYQLDRLQGTGELISSAIDRRCAGVRHKGQHKWRALVDAQLGSLPTGPDRESEELARVEKAAALEQLYASRICVLAGPAGTGKTTLLKALCHIPEVEKGGVLLLAPTGKARVRLEQQTDLSGGMTLAQFLLPLDRYDPSTGAYLVTGRDPREKSHKTAVVDESSMLTEEQLAALLDSLKGVERLILVGDPNQLPPIGSGRPFVDIVQHLAPVNSEGSFPRVGPGYCELTIRRRQAGQARDDLLFADCFSTRLADATADEVWSRLERGEPSQHVALVPWSGADELGRKLLDLLIQELKLTGTDDENAFELSLGGQLFREAAYFHAGRNGEPGAAGKAEDWQILSPVRSNQFGVEAINRLIQRTFRSRALAWAEPDNPLWRRTAKPFGRERILYGDKVINVINKARHDVFPEEGAAKYVANGEIGIVVGQYRGQNWKPKRYPWKLEVEFATQPALKYGFGGFEFGEEAQPPLELAYALTVHKTQGSEFGTTFVVLPNPCMLLSRELLYTALTRQKSKIFILHQGPLSGLRKYSEPHRSEIAQRLTNLFAAPQPVQYDGRFMEERLIHRTVRGELVRSKSEVIIANLLHSMGIDYEYERELVGSDGTRRFPDFTIEDTESGITVYLEHLGLLHEPGYRARWESKLAWYDRSGVGLAERGGGPKGALIATRDDAAGGIDCKAIEALLRNCLSL